MKHDQQCKFCGVMLHLEIDDDYAELGDILKLIPLAACNRCADFRNRQTIVFDKVASAVRLLSFIKPKEREALESARGYVRALLQRYLKVLAEYRRTQTPEFDEAVLDAIESHPEAVWEIVHRMAKTVPKNDEVLI